MLLLPEHKKTRIEEMCDCAKMYNDAQIKIQQAKIKAMEAKRTKIYGSGTHYDRKDMEEFARYTHHNWRSGQKLRDVFKEWASNKIQPDLTKLDSKK